MASDEEFRWSVTLADNWNDLQAKQSTKKIWNLNYVKFVGYSILYFYVVDM